MEAVCGHVKEAIEWVEKSFNGEKWKDHISNGVRDIFDIYNLLYIAAFTKKTDPKGSKEIANQIYKAHNEFINKNESMRAICNLFMGYAMLGDERLDGRGRAVLKNELSLLHINEAKKKDRIEEAIEDLLNDGNSLRVLFYTVNEIE